MRIWIFAVALFFVLAIPGKATEFTAPLPPEDVQALMPVETESFVQGLWEILTNAFSKINPEVSQSALSCLGVFAVVMLISVLKSLPSGSSSTILSRISVCFTLVRLETIYSAMSSEAKMYPTLSIMAISPSLERSIPRLRIAPRKSR
jgi:hypothetical protein